MVYHVDVTTITTSSATVFRFDYSYARDLEGLYVPWKAAEVPEPKLIKLNHALAEELGLDAQALDTPEGALYAQPARSAAQYKFRFPLNAQKIW